MGIKINPTRLISLAKEVAKLEINDSNRNRSFHVSIIIINKSIAAIGVNGRKSHPLVIPYGRYRTLLHSEQDAFIKVRHISDKGKVLINFRFNRNLKLMLARPCADCQTWVFDEFSNIYYSDNDGKIRRLK
jgi:hypothetical protein